MNLKIRWSEPAWLSLSEVLEYTLFQHGKRQAQKMRSQVMDAVRKISHSPYMAAVEPYSEKVGVELRENTFLSERTMLNRMGYFIE